MPRAKRQFYDTINVPLTRAMKRRVKAIAEARPERVKPTVVAREFIERGVNEAEKSMGLVGSASK